MRCGGRHGLAYLNPRYWVLVPVLSDDAVAQRRCHVRHGDMRPRANAFAGAFARAFAGAFAGAVAGAIAHALPA